MDIIVRQDSWKWIKPIINLIIIVFGIERTIVRDRNQILKVISISIEQKSVLNFLSYF